MDLVSSKEDSKPEDKSTEKAKVLRNCRSCGSNAHWTSKCPLKRKGTDTAGDKLLPDKPDAQGGPVGTETNKPGGSESYVPPNLKDDGVKRADGPKINRRDDSCAIRIGHLSYSMTDADLMELVKPFGPIVKFYLAKDKKTRLCKGFAYVHFKFNNDAAKAIARLNGHMHDHLILTADWAKSRSNQ